MTPPSLSEADCRAHDASGMADLIAQWPAQVRHQRAHLAANPWPKDLAFPTLLALGGMGGSAIAGDLVFGLAADRLPFPAAVTRDYRWPAAVGKGTLCVLSSYSGNTEETLALHRSARERGAAVVGLTTGGALGALLTSEGAPWTALPAGLPPRAALGYSVVSLAYLLEALGVGPGGAPAWDEAEDALETGNARFAPAVPEDRNPAKALARSLVGRAVVVYAAAGWPAAVARRWKGQINENAKALAFAGALPEMNHNEIVGWQALGDLHARFAAVFLADRGDLPQVARRAAVTRAIIEEEGVVAHACESLGDTPLARLLSLVQLGDWVSYYLAILAGVDPTPIAKIDRLKTALAAPGESPVPGGGPRTP